MVWKETGKTGEFNGAKSTKAYTDFDEAALERAVSNTVAAICERFGKGPIIALGGDPVDQPRHDATQTGTLNLDDALGIGSLPLGRIVEIYGPESSGTTTLALRLIAEAQRHDLACAFIDADHTLDVQVARSLGVNSSELLVIQPDHGEEALAIADSLAGTREMGLIVVNSVAALIPKAGCHIGLQARLTSQAVRKLSSAAAQTNTLIVFITQGTSGSPDVRIVSSAVTYYASVRLEVDPEGQRG